MTKEEKQKIKELKKNKNYEEIFRQFGQKEYIKNVDRKYKKMDITKLKREGKFEDIYLRYGNSQYNKLLSEAKQREIEEIYGKRSFKAISHKISHRIKATAGALLIGTGILGGTGVTAISGITIAQSEIIKGENEEKYKDLIEEYEEQNKNYAENIRKLGLTDLETIMKLQKDMHSSIEGYGQPSLNIEGYFGLDIGKGNLSGVCKNMADDYARKMNAINPDYNARTWVVKANIGSSNAPNIQTYSGNQLLDGGSKFEDPSEMLTRGAVNKIKEITQNKDVNNVLGNHMVVAVDIKEKNLTLVVDPTNPSIGVFKNGEIIMLNSLGLETPFTMYRTPIDDLGFRGFGALEVPNEYVKSFLNTSITIDKLNEEYGVEAQNNALKAAQEKEENYMYNLYKRNSFKDSIKVKISEEHQYEIYSVEEMREAYKVYEGKIDNELKKEEVIELGNIFKRLEYSIDYYDEQQKELLQKEITHAQDIMSIKENLGIRDINDMREKLKYKMLETNAVYLPEDLKLRECICDMYLGIWLKGQNLQDLNIALDENENENCYYIISNDSTVLITVAQNKENTDEIKIYNNHSGIPERDKSEEEIKELLAKSSSIITLEKQNTIDER